MTIQRKRVAKRLASGLLAGALALGGLAISGSSVSAKTPSTALKRIQGTDRYSTALAIASQYTNSSNNGTWAGSANLILASGENYPDALAASALSKVVNAPIILTKSNELPSSVRDWLLTKQGALNASVSGKVYVVGGESAVSEAVVTEVLSTINTAADAASPHVAVRLGGADRYATAAAINAVTGLISAGDAVVLVSGSSYADAVSAAPLAYKAGWPIVPVQGASIGASGLATITAYLTAQGGASAGKFLIVGGTSAVPLSVESELMAAGVKYANVVRVSGADRYQTALNLNSAIWSGLSKSIHGQSLDGSKIALVTGSNFPDALAAGPFLGLMGIHGMLTTGSGLNPYASALISTVATYGQTKPTELWAIGGTAALSDDTYAAGKAAAQSTDIAFTSLVCTEGSSTLLLTFNEGESTYGLGADGLTAAESAAVQAAFSQDGVAIASTAGAVELGLTAASLATFVDLNGNGVNDALAVGIGTSGTTKLAVTGSTTVSFAGVTEATAGNGRGFGTASCTLADDIVGPAIAIDARIKTGGTVSSVFVTANEDLDCTSSDHSKLTFGTTTAAANSQKEVTVSANSSDTRSCKIELDANVFAGLAATDVAKAVASFIKDTAGNFNAAGTDENVKVALDNVKPAATGASTVCLDGTEASVTHNNLTVTAKDLVADGGTKAGVLGNGYKVSIVTQRGLLVPSVSIDDTAKTITVLADVQYHTAADVVQWVANNKPSGSGDWAFTGTAALTATIVPGTTSGGNQTCTLTVNANERISAATISSLVVNGLSLAADDGTFVPGMYKAPVLSVSASGTSRFKVSFRPTTAVSAGSVVLAGTMTDHAGTQEATLAVTS